MGVLDQEQTTYNWGIGSVYLDNYRAQIFQAGITGFLSDVAL